MFSDISFWRAVASPGIIPLILTAVAAWIDYYYDTNDESKKNKRKRARWIFIVTGLIGTGVSVFLFAQEQQNAQASAAQAAKFSANLAIANNQLTALTLTNGQLNSKINEIQAELAKDVDEILARLSNSPPAVVNNSYNTAVTSNTLVNIQKILVSFNDVETAQSRAANSMIRAKIEDANHWLQFHSPPAADAVVPPDTKTPHTGENTNRLPPRVTGLHVIPPPP
jgi:hypothetical protein